MRGVGVICKGVHLSQQRHCRRRKIMLIKWVQVPSDQWTCLYMEVSLLYVGGRWAMPNIGKERRGGSLRLLTCFHPALHHARYLGSIFIMFALDILTLWHLYLFMVYVVLAAYIRGSDALVPKGGSFAFGEILDMDILEGEAPKDGPHDESPMKWRRDSCRCRDRNCSEPSRIDDYPASVGTRYVSLQWFNRQALGDIRVQSFSSHLSLLSISSPCWWRLP